MIDRVHVKRFESLFDVELALGQFTVIQGDNDQGKSAFIRSLNGLLFNDQHKDSVSLGESTMSVIVVEEGTTVKWTKGAKNSYLLRRDPTAKVVEFNRIGRAVPDEIISVLNVQPVELVGEEIKLQCQDQFDGPIVKSRTSGVLAQLFDQLLGVDRLTRAIGFCRRDLLRSQAELKVVQGQLDSMEGHLLEWRGARDELLSVREVVRRIKGLRMAKELFAMRAKSVKLHLLLVELTEKLVKMSAMLRIAGVLLKYLELGPKKGMFRDFSTVVAALFTELGKLAKIGSLCDLALARSGAQEGVAALSTSQLGLNKQECFVLNERTSWMRNLQSCPSCGSLLNEVKRQALLSSIGAKDV